MSHPIFVCLPHRLTFHTVKAAEQHAKAHDLIISYKALFVEIGVCSQRTCGKNKPTPSRQKELDKAREAARKLARDT